MKKEEHWEEGKLRFLGRMKNILATGQRYTKPQVEKLALGFGINNKNEVKELTELAIVTQARQLAQGPGTAREKYEAIVSLYQSHVNLSHRTSQSIMLQQYSTPAPISYLMGWFCGIDRFYPGQLAFEPSAGNGLLTIAGDPKKIIVNEVDDVRRAHLEHSNYLQVLRQDASEPFTAFYKKFDAVLTNPPFGNLPSSVQIGSYTIKPLDHLMAIRGLDTMKDSGRAALIIGGHTTWDDKGRIQAGKNRIFFNYLYHHYQVADVIQVSGKNLYSRQGTAFNTRLILIEGRKKQPEGAAPLYDPETDGVVWNFDTLFDRVEMARDNIKPQPKMKTNKMLELQSRALKLKLELMEFGTLGAPYEPASDSCRALNTVVPDAMSFETQNALKQIRQAVGGDMDAFVRHRLQYPSKSALCNALSAEQTDAVAMAIYNIEARRQGMIIGDQTGIGKGRVAAAMIRYAVKQGLKPIFLTEKPNLFSDIYRDLSAIGSASLVPFIVNARQSKTDIKDENGNVVYQALSPSEQQSIFSSGELPSRYDFVVATYSQFNSIEKKPLKPQFLSSIAKENIVILDESHNSSGSSNTGVFMQSILVNTQGVVFLSATFAKRPDNMPVYAMKTAINEANMSRDDLVTAIQKGGVALQEILASQLVAEGQMLRRERSFEGVEVNYLTLDDEEQEHKAIADNVTDILRDIITFQSLYITPLVEEMDLLAAEEGAEVLEREGTQKAGVDNMPYFSKVFQVINQMLFSIKAGSVAERAIMRLKEGKKPVIAFASTMGSFIESLENERGLPVSDGDVIRADFAEVLVRGLDGVMRYTETDPMGKRIQKRFTLNELDPEARQEYERIYLKIKNISTGISLSPIDVVVQKLTRAGYKVAEVTGRKYEVQLNAKGDAGMVKSRKRVNTNDAFRQFNNNEIDVLMINQSGSTGASAHAIVTPKIPASEVKQRVMIVLQAELDINTEVQKRGRINRTGQILKPIYDYVTSAIPAEKRLMMMLQKKLKSLDANTTSNQKQSSKILDVPDFLNKYGDVVVATYLKEYPDINATLDDPLKFDTKGDDASFEMAAHKVSGRVAVLPTEQQAFFYNEIARRYNDYVDYLKQTGEYDLEVEAMDLQAETIDMQVVKVGKGGSSEFGTDSILETVKANVLKKPFSATELDNLIRDALQGRSATALRDELLENYTRFAKERLDDALLQQDKRFDRLIREAPKEKAMQKVLESKGGAAFDAAVRGRIRVLEEKRELNKQKEITNARNKEDYLKSIFRFYSIGRYLRFPLANFEGEGYTDAVFLGYDIDFKRPNPYAPSSLSLRFALANGNKYLKMPASFSKELQAIMGASTAVPAYAGERLLSEWERGIRESSADRKIRYIITGNLLQAFADYPGKLVSYTTASGEERKGVLLPEYWVPEERSENRIPVPISAALKIIKSMGPGSQLNTSNKLSLFRQGDGYKVITPLSRRQGGDFYLDPDLLQYVNNGQFEKVADKMVAYLPFAHIEGFVQVLQEKHNLSVNLSSFQFDVIKDDLPKMSDKKFPKLSVPKEENHIKLLELEAKALALKLKLLNFAA